MQVSKNGFPVQRGGQSGKKASKNVFLVMELVVRGRQRIEVIQEFHQDYRILKASGFKIIDKFEVT